MVLLCRDFWLINLKDLLRSQTLVSVTFWESDPALSGSVPFFSYCQFSCGKNRRDEVAGLLAVLQSRLSISLLSRLVSSWATEPSLLIVCMSSLLKCVNRLHQSLHRSDNLNVSPGMVTTYRGQLTSTQMQVPEFWGLGTGWRTAAVGPRRFFLNVIFKHEFQNYKMIF